jgi:hypothetical protein
VIVGGSGGWQISQTERFEELGVDCVVEGRREPDQAVGLFHRVLRGESLPRFVQVDHPAEPRHCLRPESEPRSVSLEMTTGFGRLCQFCLTDFRNLP